MNKLYSLLTSGSTGDWTFYSKSGEAVCHTERSLGLARSMTRKAGDDREALKRLACVICRESLSTMFGPEIRALDPENTYMDVGRASAAVEEGDPSCVFTLTESSASMRRLLQWLDDDIKDRLSAPTWFEWMAAGALQLLREAT